jgi:hypothetical protein
MLYDNYFTLKAPGNRSNLIRVYMVNPLALLEVEGFSTPELRCYDEAHRNLSAVLQLHISIPMFY